jgi:hypothetical protein
VTHLTTTRTIRDPARRGTAAAREIDTTARELADAHAARQRRGRSVS